MIGLAAAYFGVVLAREVVSKIVKKKKEEFEENTADEIEGGVV